MFKVEKIKRGVRLRLPSFSIFLGRLVVTLRFLGRNYKSDFPITVICGVPRSGTTLVRSLVATHPDIACPQSEFFMFPSKNARKEVCKKLELSKKEMEELGDFRNPAEFSENALRAFARKNKKKLAACKAPLHILFMDTISRHFPNAKFIHVIRDGRDVACSLRTHPKRAFVDGKMVPLKTNNPFKNCVKLWRVFVYEGLKGRGRKNYLEIKYEDAVNDPVGSMKKVFRFLSVPIISEKDIKGFYKKEIGTKHVANIEVGKPLYSSSVGRWKKDMSKSEKEAFKRIAGDLLIELGYEKDLNW